MSDDTDNNWNLISIILEALTIKKQIKKDMNRFIVVFNISHFRMIGRHFYLMIQDEKEHSQTPSGTFFLLESINNWSLTMSMPNMIVQ